MRYFDKDFFKFLLAFIAIIAASTVIIIGMQLYVSADHTPSSVQAKP